ncbi:MAG: redoxin domain-containing protein, partial [Planctomycetota bacterium]
MRHLSILLLAVVAAAPAAAEPLINARHRLLEDLGGDGATRMASRVGDLAFNDVEGQTRRVDEKPAACLVFLSTSCPLAKRYTQRLNRLHEAFADSGIGIYGVFSNAEDDRGEVIAHAEKMGFAFPVVKDSNGYLARRVGAAMTPQAIVVDQQGVIRYRGAIDDNRYENRVKDRYLQDALTALRDGLPIVITETKSLGCSIHLPKASDVEKPTFTQHVARILQDNCQSCHRDGQVAPFAIANYDEARTWATEINAYAQARLMPPWKPAADFGQFLHDRRLTDDDLALLERWVEAGAPEGPRSAAPPAPKYNDQWALGEPDYVLEMPEEYVIAPEGEDDYRHFIVPTDFETDRFVKASDIIPGNRQTVHHVILYVDTSGKARELDAADPGPGYTRFGDVGFEPASGLGGWAPGTTPRSGAAGNRLLVAEGRRHRVASSLLSDWRRRA